MSFLEMNHTLVSSHGHRAATLENLRRTNCEFCGLPKFAEYFCKECYVHMCEDCFKVPQEISHWLHPNHRPLRLNITDGCVVLRICDGCNYVLAAHGRYKCDSCEFCVCVECGTSTASKRLLGWENNKELLHYSHIHTLERCRFREEDKFSNYGHIKCEICELPMWGISYTCRIGCEHFIHESCIDIPRVMQHPLHPHPLLRLDNMISPGPQDVGSCIVCDDWDTYPFFCMDCDWFALHLQCAKSALRAIKLESHGHPLLCVFSHRAYVCHVCDRLIYGSSFRCLECDSNLHVECVHVPRSFKHTHHQHTLTLMDPSTEFASPCDEYYCDICEATRDQRLHVYCCERCKFYGHIECVLAKEEGFSEFSSSSLWAKNDNETKPQAKPYNSSNDKQIQHASHEHPLSLRNVTNQLCEICLLQINGEAYACEQCLDEFCVHEKCAALPQIFHHPLHPNHSLTLVSSFLGSRDRSWFICDICADIWEGFNFFCRSCGFVIDIKCAFSTEGRELFDNKHQKERLKHPVHEDHELTLSSLMEFTDLECEICGDKVSGPVYCCTECGSKFYHKTCLEWPIVVKAHPLLPQHVLRLFGSKPLLDATFIGHCFACMLPIEVLGYQVIGSRNMHFHLECGTSLARVLNLQHHGHRLYYFHNRPSRGTSRQDMEISCVSCGGIVEDSYYLCLKCMLYFHLRCLRLPRTAKHKRHIHWLAFEDYIDYVGYYCDICEEPRDSEHPIYSCHDCKFVAHIECMVSQESASSVTLEEIQSDHGERDDIKIPMCRSSE